MYSLVKRRVAHPAANSFFHNKTSPLLHLEIGITLVQETVCADGESLGYTVIYPEACQAATRLQSVVKMRIPPAASLHSGVVDALATWHRCDPEIRDCFLLHTLASYSYAFTLDHGSLSIERPAPHSTAVGRCVKCFFTCNGHCLEKRWN